MAKLTDKQKLFVEAYLECWNATEAARRAKYAYPNTQGPRLLVHVGIRKIIQERLSAKAMSADEVLMRLAEQARGDISDFIRSHGAIDWDAVHAKGYLVKKIRHTSGKESAIELHDAQAALEKIGRAHGLFIDRQKIEHGGEVEHIVKIIRPPAPEDE